MTYQFIAARKANDAGAMDVPRLGGIRERLLCVETAWAESAKSRRRIASGADRADLP